MFHFWLANILMMHGLHLIQLPNMASKLWRATVSQSSDLAWLGFSHWCHTYDATACFPAFLSAKVFTFFPFRIHSLLSLLTFFLSLPFWSPFSPFAQFLFFPPVILFPLSPFHYQSLFPESKNECKKSDRKNKQVSHLDWSYKDNTSD